MELLAGSWHAICRLLVPMAPLSSPTRPRASSVTVGRRKPHTRRRKRRDSDLCRSTSALPLCPASSVGRCTSARAEMVRAAGEMDAPAARSSLCRVASCLANPPASASTRTSQNGQSQVRIALLTSCASRLWGVGACLRAETPFAHLA